MPQCIETTGKVPALDFKDIQASAIAKDVAFGRIRAVSLLAGVIDLERENGKPIDYETGRFGIERSGRIG